MELVRNGIIEARTFIVKTQVHPCPSHFEATLHVFQDGNSTATLAISTDLVKVTQNVNCLSDGAPTCSRYKVT